MAKRMDTKQWAAYHARLTREYWPAIMRGARSGALRGVAILQQRTKQAIPASDRGGRGAFDTGRFERGWKQRVSAGLIRFWNDSPYAIIVERGRRPGAGAPPAASLEGWVRRKLGLSGSEARGAAFAIARAIGRRGLRPRHILAGSLKDIEKAIQTEILAELRKTLRA